MPKSEKLRLSIENRSLPSVKSVMVSASASVDPPSPARSTIVSEPLPVAIVSAPVPPSIESSPYHPMRISFPAPPVRLSLPPAVKLLYRMSYVVRGLAPMDAPPSPACPISP